MITIRFARKTDAPAIVALAKAMADHHYALDPEHYRKSSEYEKLENYPEEWINDKSSAIVVAEEDNALKGYAVAAIENAKDFMAPHIKKIGVIHGVFIETASRKKGIGRALVMKAIEWLQKKGAGHIELTVDANNNESYAAWKKLGFEDYKIRMRLDQK